MTFKPEPPQKLWRALDAWLESSPHHKTAFLRVSMAWKAANRLRKLRRPEEPLPR